MFLVFSLFAYNISGMITLYLYHVTGFKIISAYYLVISQYGIALGAIGFLIIAMGSSRLASFLMIKPIKFLGKISYSLYLYHTLILLTCIHLFNGTLPLWLICIVALFLGITVSYIAWYFIEAPSMKIGRKIADRVRNVGKRNKQEIAKVSHISGV